MEPKLSIAGAALFLPRQGSPALRGHLEDQDPLDLPSLRPGMPRTLALADFVDFAVIVYPILRVRFCTWPCILRSVHNH
jgi:hypothetical protein